MAHITGGGLADNLERVLPKNVDAVIDRGAWNVPAVFRFLQSHGKVDEEEMRRVFNMGIGYVVIVRPAFAAAVTEKLEKSGERVFAIGKITRGAGRVTERE
jgi:phosphoribosylformylglycinamidine cyclo-ligase